MNLRRLQARIESLGQSEAQGKGHIFEASGLRRKLTGKKSLTGTENAGQLGKKPPKPRGRNSDAIGFSSKCPGEAVSFSGGPNAKERIRG